MKTRQKIRLTITFTSFLLFPIFINFLSPVLILDGASKGIVNGSFILFGLLFLSSLFFGRAWCAWLCPVSGMQSACTFRKKKAKTGAGNVVSAVIWLFWVGFIVFLFFKVGGINEVNPLHRNEQIISILAPIIVFVYLGVILLVFGMLLIWGNRAFCKYLCWMAHFMIIGDKIRQWLKLDGLKLKADKDKCINCKICNDNCPMDIDVMAMVQKNNMYNRECILCLQCVDSCPKKTINTK